jgi:AhpD family alkylhydroperoxidase
MPRMDYRRVGQDVFKAMGELQTHVDNTGLDPLLLNLVYLRVSEINGCAYCIDMHSKDLRAMGESDIRLDLINVWRETPSLYSEKEQAALSWAESVTKVSETHIPDEDFQLARKHFSEEELAKLTLAIVAINGWNRLAISARMEPGRYKSNLKPVKQTTLV